MYANESSVRTLCINVRSGLDTNFITEMASMADAVIDATMAERFYWPEDPEGNPVNSPPPDLIVQVANRLTAAYIEKTKFAINEANGQIDGNPYAKSLESEAKRILTELKNGDLVIHTLQEVAPIRSSPSPKSFFEIQGRSGISGRSRTRR